MAVLLTLLLVAGSLPLATSHPEKMICKDPRLVDGGMMMHNFVVSNQYTSALVFSASASSYSAAGDEIHLSVKANGSKYVNESAPMGVFLAIQSRSACTLVGDHGSFSGASPDLDYTAGCSSGVFSKTATGKFAGSSHVVWKAGPGTTGNVTFTLIWSNGPGASDALSVSGAVRVPDSYLYTKTITITGRPGHCPPPVPQPAPPTPGSPDKCVWGGAYEQCPFEGVRAPVFIQNLEEDGQQTFPSGRCLRCRVDHRGTCKSAMVLCPSEPGAGLQEKIWDNSSDCEGEPSRVAYLSARDGVRCPGPEHYSVEGVDLERFVPKLQRDHPEYVPDEATARKAVEEYRRLLWLVQRFPDQPVVPSKLVDLAWHEHILDTMSYKRDCLRLFGRFVHHNPSFGGAEEKAELQQQQEEMFKAYHRAFHEHPPLDVWPTAKKAVKSSLGAGGPLPDCCSAKCVKPSCHDCVACNSIDCGYLGAGKKGHKGAGKKTLSPDVFAGYVPAAGPSLAAPPPVHYACGLTTRMPVTSPYVMQLNWTICGERIHFRQSLAGISAWHSVGLAGEGQEDMGLGDYTLTMMTRNYSGVMDLYKYDKGNGYPCFDVLYECSLGNETKGTKDVEGESVQRVNGATVSTWSRKLKTPDVKDRPITRGNTTVLLAHGTEDYFKYHELHAESCVVDFFSGASACPKPAAVAGLESYV